MHGVSLSVQPDEIVALIGPNGAGKTTTLKTIAGLLRPEEGTITYGSKLLSGMGAAEIVAEGIILIPEGRMIFGSLTVRENLHVGAYLLKDRKQIQEREEFVLDMFPALANRLNQMGETLSGGEQQMLADWPRPYGEPRDAPFGRAVNGLGPFACGVHFSNACETSPGRHDGSSCRTKCKACTECGFACLRDGGR